MATTIVLKNSVTTTNTPSSLAQGEVAINVTDKKVWVGNAATTPIQIVNGGPDGVFTSVTDSGLTNTRVTYAGAGGLLKDSASITTDGTTITAAFSGAHNGTVGATTPAAGTFTTLTASSTLSFPSQSIPFAALPTGSILQVVSTAKTDTFSTSSTSYVDITGVSVSITPKFSTSKILVMFSGQITSATGVNSSGIQLTRASTAIFVGDASGSMVRATAMAYGVNADSQYSANFSYIDSPATTSSTTYAIQMRANSAGTAYLNRSSNDNGTATDFRTPASITVMEIAA